MPKSSVYYFWLSGDLSKGHFIMENIILFCNWIHPQGAVMHHFILLGKAMTFWIEYAKLHVNLKLQTFIFIFNTLQQHT